MPENLSEGTLSARPFPWFCPRCRRKEVRRTMILYERELSHEGRPVTVVIPNLAVPQCTHCGELVFDYEADEQVRQAFAAQVCQEQRFGREATVTPPHLQKHDPPAHEMGRG